ncbi:MAG TPA: hypothetical protein VLT13_00865 [Bacteroidota bacterium]|nr:hypothetical protein [Bacteroidota bacterium]
MTRALLILFLSTALLTGCGASFSPFTQDVRTTHTLAECVFHIGTNVEFRSLRVIEQLDTTGFFKNDGRRYLLLTTEDPGKAIAEGDDWISVDFGRGIVLEFRRSGPAGVYATPGWGTTTIGEERYDIQVGMLSGNAIQLLWEPIRKTDNASSPQ